MRVKDKRWQNILPEAGDLIATDSHVWYLLVDLKNGTFGLVDLDLGNLFMTFESVEQLMQQKEFFRFKEIVKDYEIVL